MNQTEVSIISASIAAIALVLNCVALWSNTRARKIDTFNRIRERIQDLSLKVTEAKKNATEPLWDGTFFNELEWLAYLTHRGEIPVELVLEHIGSTILVWHEGLFLNNVPDEQKNDREIYAEYKRLVSDIRLLRSRGGRSRTWRRVIRSPSAWMSIELGRRV